MKSKKYKKKYLDQKIIINALLLKIKKLKNNKVKEYKDNININKDINKEYKDNINKEYKDFNINKDNINKYNINKEYKDFNINKEYKDFNINKDNINKYNINKDITKYNINDINKDNISDINKDNINKDINKDNISDINKDNINDINKDNISDINKDNISDINKDINKDNININKDNINKDNINKDNISDINKDNINKDSININKDNISDINNEINDIKNIFLKKKNKIEFKNNFCNKKFIKFCAQTYEFNLQNRKINKFKNPLRMYILINKDKIIKYLIDNINFLSLNEICSSFFLINSELDFKYKLIIANDIILRVKIRSRILFIISSLFNNLSFFDNKDNIDKYKKDSISILSFTIQSIMYHQFCIDTDYFKDKYIYSYLEEIKENFNLTERITLHEHLDVLLGIDDVKIIINENKSLKINELATSLVFSMKLICHILDWDFTFNQIIIKKLNYKVNSLHLYLLGDLAINAYYNFGFVDSVKDIFNEIMCIMKNNDEIGFLCFLYLKKIRKDFISSFLDKFKNSLMDYEVSFLKNYRII